MSNSEYKKTYQAGETIIKQGEPGDSAFIIESGRVEILVENRKGDANVLGSRGEGTMIGEMALIDDAPRTATVKALEDCELLEITKDDFTLRLNNLDPILRMTMQVILTRYRDTLERSKIVDDPPGMNMVETLEVSYAEDSGAMEAVKIANNFEKALGGPEVSLHYQPMIELATGKVKGFEALMRWINGEKGFISPGVFIPIIEDNGLIVKASSWALEESLLALKRIEDKGAYDKELFMSVNFSSRDFAADGFVESVYKTISKSDVAAEQLHLEITERLLMGQPENAKDTLSECQKAGIGISIDDFGTGYSSLSYLHYFPINILKIDRSFVMKMLTDESSYQLVKSMISLGKNLKMKIIAEGVETQEEAQKLRELGCDMAQGYYFCKPLPEKDVIEFLLENRKIDF